jgi:TPR repeat protein
VTSERPAAAPGAAAPVSQPAARQAFSSGRLALAAGLLVACGTVAAILYAARGGKESGSAAEPADSGHGAKGMTSTTAAGPERPPDSVYSSAIDAGRKAMADGKLDEAEKFFREAVAAKPGDAEAVFLMGRLAFEKKDFAAAAKLYQEASERGHAEAAASLGAMYAEGQGVERNDSEAVRLYAAAAERGSAVAQVNLGWMYRDGRGVEANDAKAAECFRKAAEQGDPRGQYCFGLMCEKGWGVEKNLSLAEEWYGKSAEKGYEPAREKLRRLGSK